MVPLNPKNHFSLSKFLSFSLFISIFFTISHSDDFSSLLTFKSKVDTSNFLISWSKNNDPCSSWLGVTCHPVTRRVIKLVLNHLNLTGSVHPLIHLTQIRHLSLHNNFLTSFPNFNSWPNLKHVYLSHNNFSGEFPPEIYRLKRLRRLDLSYNKFSGEIPVTEFHQLPHLMTLHLEFNSFSGSLGMDETRHVASFKDFNVSGNNFSGKIPNWLSKFPVASFTGNVHLCGYPLRSICPSETVNSNPTVMNTDPSQLNFPNQKKKNLSENMFLLIVTIDAVGVMLTVLVITWCCYYRKKKNQEKQIYNKVKKYHDSSNSSSLYHSFEYGHILKDKKSDQFATMVCFEGCKGFSKVEDLLKASAEMLGKGSVGTSYKVAMDCKDVVVVKRVIEKLKKMKDLDGFLRLIGGLRHQNVVSLRAYYSSKEELLLVYDFLPNGSLHNLLHGNRGPGRTPLDWSTRLKYALGAAKGLASLHSYNKTKICHGNFTSSNILIDHFGNACISDICLHLLLQMPISSNNGYKAPELSTQNNMNTNQNPRKLSQKCDVYSFGVVLLEILTGKIATSEGETSLTKWVQRVVNKEWTWDVFDFELARYKEMEDEMVALLKVAMACLVSSPKDRPKMIVVEKMIEEIRKTENR
ncbi:probable leucine-rich repeat receptor-like protein kinase At1g68400 isoform X1 [Nicotiana tomentosiformis]|uniref:probable leucine-rich repeat receptor-like protein kinase At1g68400 isoform X1 n=1 Tax=Nicotiana tomentosiformis TaxID=4098 RepID=UPI00051B0406|nr:probable leucine-rich repeat receptor-like protein kinase At1g68400 isoform X1 [Nicotiana tomentosiformis]